MVGVRHNTSCVHLMYVTAGSWLLLRHVASWRNKRSFQRDSWISYSERLVGIESNRVEQSCVNSFTKKKPCLQTAQSSAKGSAGTRCAAASLRKRRLWGRINRAWGHESPPVVLGSQGLGCPIREKAITRGTPMRGLYAKADWKSARII